MLLYETQIVRRRWPIDNFEKMYEICHFIFENNPTKAGIASKFKMGSEKARSFLESLHMLGITTYNRKMRVYEPTTFCKILINNDYNKIDKLSLMYFAYVQNYEFTYWFINRFCQNKTMFFINDLEYSLEKFKDELESKTELKHIRDQVINNDLKSLTSTYMFGQLKVFSNYDNTKVLIHQFTPSIPALTIMFRAAWEKWLFSITNIDLNALITHEGFPFRTFFINHDYSLKLLLELEKAGVITLNMSSGLRQVILNKRFDSNEKLVIK
jgi:hypothetical protein